MCVSVSVYVRSDNAAQPSHHFLSRSQMTTCDRSFFYLSRLCAAAGIWKQFGDGAPEEDFWPAGLGLAVCSGR